MYSFRQVGYQLVEAMVTLACIKCCLRANFSDRTLYTKLNAQDPFAYLKDGVARLPTQKTNAIDEPMPHNRKSVILVNM